MQGGIGLARGFLKVGKAEQNIASQVEKKCNEKGTFFFTNWWKHAMMSLLYMPVELYVHLSVFLWSRAEPKRNKFCHPRSSSEVKGLWDAMHGWGTDEYTLTGLASRPKNGLLFAQGNPSFD